MKSFGIKSLKTGLSQSIITDTRFHVLVKTLFFKSNMCQFYGLACILLNVPRKLDWLALLCGS